MQRRAFVEPNTIYNAHAVTVTALLPSAYNVLHTILNVPHNFGWLKLHNSSNDSSTDAITCHLTCITLTEGRITKSTTPHATLHLPPRGAAVAAPAGASAASLAGTEATELP